MRYGTRLPSRDVGAMAAGKVPSEGKGPIPASPLKPCDLRICRELSINAERRGAKQLQYDWANRASQTDHFTRYAPEHIEVNDLFH